MPLNGAACDAIEVPALLSPSYTIICRFEVMSRAVYQRIGAGV